MTGDLVTHSVVSISIIMHPQRWLLQNINLIKVYDSISSTQSELVAGDLVTQSVVSISIFMHPQRWLLQNINLSKVLQRRVSISNSRECKVVHDWRSGHSLCCFDLNYHALSCTLNADCFKILISARSIIRFLQRRVSISNSRECKVVHDWQSGHSFCCFDLNYHAPSTLIASEH